MRKTTFFLRNVGFEFPSLNSFFHEQFAKKQHVQDSFLRKSCFPKNVFAKILGNQDLGMRKIWVRSFSKDVPCLYVILKYIHNVCICDVAILYMMTGNHLFFLRKTCFLKNAGHKSLRLIAKWQLDNIYVEPLVCEEPGPGSSQTTACSLALLCASLWFA